MSIFKMEKVTLSIFYEDRTDNPSLNAEINLGDDNVGFRRTLGTKCGAENQEFSPWLRLINRHIVRTLFQFGFVLC